MRKIISYKPSKMNISTEIKHAYLDSYKTYIDSSHSNYKKDNIYEYEPLKAIKEVKTSIEELVKTYMDIFGSSGRVVDSKAG